MIFECLFQKLTSFLLSFLHCFILFFVISLLRNAQSETVLQKMQVDLEGAQAAKERLEADNLALYSKIRYLQSYGASSAGGAPFKSPQVLYAVCAAQQCKYLWY